MKENSSKTHTAERTETGQMIKEQMGYVVWVSIRPVIIDDSTPRLSGGWSRAKWGTETRICPGWRIGAEKWGRPARSRTNITGFKEGIASAESRRGNKQ